MSLFLHSTIKIYPKRKLTLIREIGIERLCLTPRELFCLFDYIMCFFTDKIWVRGYIYNVSVIFRENRLANNLPTSCLQNVADHASLQITLFIMIFFKCQYYEFVCRWLPRGFYFRVFPLLDWYWTKTTEFSLDSSNPEIGQDMT